MHKKTETTRLSIFWYKVQTISTIRIKGFYILHVQRNGKVTTSMLAYVPENHINQSNIKDIFNTAKKRKKLKLHVTKKQKV